MATNDTAAVYKLLRDGYSLPRPIVRFWDLIVLDYQLSNVDDAMCDKIRQTLAAMSERLPGCFTGKSFKAGLNDFYARLVDHQKPTVGAVSSQEKFDDRIVLIAK